MENKIDVTRLIKVSKYAREKGISTTWVHKLIERGDVKSVKIDGMTFVKESTK